MKENEVFSTELETYPTKDIHDNHTNGNLTVIWRDWDEIIKNHPKMVYVTSVNPGEIKGPHLHRKRTSHFVCIKGKIIFVIQKNNNSYVEIESSEEKPVLVHVPKNIASAHINLSNDCSLILALADIAWKPNDNEMENLTFENYDWTKWKK
ncbi:WxcM-like domain-containing protein [Marine Group I thaumarchaeote]|uniref:WxcM-like domain-containing protein n=1 Tax=Marine Group I thaumarchaeote TaxID=2511932 RepID=A0A7K4MM46_9ARCH|nr:WxcM-like domain-containing protein [Marine Group I thaumarchaeote]